MNEMTKAGRERGHGAGVAGAPDASGLATRSMPESLEAEAAVLGSMIIDPECISNVVEILRTESFYRTEHRMIFDALVGLYEKSIGDNIAIDAVLLRDELKKRKQLEEVGGVEYIARVMDSVPSSANVMYYAGIVKDKQLLREMIGAAYGILELGYREDGEAEEKLDMAEQKMFAVADRRVRSRAEEIKDLVTQALELIEKREGSHVTGLATGYHLLDRETCGLQNGEMIILAGRPSMGKTSLALNMAEYMGAVEKVPVAIFSLEMGKQQLAERFLCSMSRIRSDRIKRGTLFPEEFERLKDACADLYQVPIYVDDTSLLTPLELRGKARRLKSLYDIRCIIVDYLQLMHFGTGRVESRQQEITLISRYMKALASELNIPVVVLSQLNRAPEGREDHRPRMSDLRESGSIEQDADVVLLLHREDYYSRSEARELSETLGGTMVGSDEPAKENTAELIIAKQRNGPTGKVDLIFRKEIMRFENKSQLKEQDVPF